MRKKCVGIILTVGLCLAAAGCGTAGENVETGTSETEEPEADTEYEAGTEEASEPDLSEEPDDEMTEDSEPETEAEEETAEIPEESEEEPEPETEAEETAEISEEPEDEPETEEETAEIPEDPEEEPETEAEEEPETEVEEETAESVLPGASLNGTQFAEGDDPQRVTYEDGFYYEPVSDALLDYITGSSYPELAGGESVEISPYDLRYVHVLHYDFDGQPAEGELICNAAIAQDLVEIFCELYKNEYQIEQIHLVDEYGGDDDASMAANNTSCFNYRNVANSESLSKHALGRAIDINPLYNPYITYNSDGRTNCSPPEGWAYADRSADFAHKIDTSDLCYQLFTAHGFTWGGSWNSSKDYQHFQKG